jgi:hypothetical protein
MIYQATSGACGARRMMVDFYTFKATQGMMRRQAAFPPEFMSDLTMSLMSKREVSAMGWGKSGMGVEYGTSKAELTGWGWLQCCMGYCNAR